MGISFSTKISKSQKYSFAKGGYDSDGWFAITTAECNGITGIPYFLCHFTKSRGIYADSERLCGFLRKCKKKTLAARHGPPEICQDL
jgi:hypothetical protein